MTSRNFPVLNRINGMNRWLCGVSSAALVLALSAASTPVMAQADDEAEEFVLEEIIVTARRYSESLRDAPLAIGVMSRDYLDIQRIESVNDMMDMTPGASYVSFSKVQPEKVMRGVVAPTPGNSSSESSIQLVIDGVTTTKDFMKSPPIYDVDHVEILRGPQGTTFGRNASIGLIHIITRRPTQEFEAGMNLTIANFGRYEADGFVSGPLSDTVSARVAFNFDTEDGPTESISTGKGLDGEKNFAFRGSLLWEPSSNLSIFLKMEYSEDNDEAPVRHGLDCTTPNVDGQRETGFPVGPTHPRYAGFFFDSCDPFKTEITPDIDFFLKRQIFSLTNEIVWNISDDVTLTSITGFMDGTNDALMDALGTPFQIMRQKVDNDGYFISEEIRIDNHASGDRLRWLGGVYYLKDDEDRFEENRFFQDGVIPPPPPRPPTNLATISNNVTESFAVFGELSFDITEKANITAGGRWTQDEKDYTYSVSAFGFRPIIAGVTGCGAPIVCGTRDNPAGFAPIELGRTWSDFMARVSLDYEINDDHNVYALWSQGFKSGGFQPDARNPEAASVPFNPERSNNYEIGWKGRIGGRAQFSIAGYFLRNKGTQTVTLIPVGQGFTGLIANVGAVETIGVEADFTWLVTENIRFGGNFSILDAELKNTILTVGVDDDGNRILNDVSGLRPDAAPNWTAMFYAEFDYVMGDGSVLTLRGDYRGRSNVFDDISERDTKARLRPELGIIGARVTWEAADSAYRIMFWGKNLNEDIDIENIGPRQPNTLQLPFGFTGKREFGVTMGFKF